MEAIQLVRMQEEHLDALEEICRASFSRPWTKQGLAAELASETARFLTAVDAHGLVCGFAGMQNVFGECYIDLVAVHPEKRRHGVGRVLVQGLIDLAQREHAAFITLEVRQSNVPALALYNGFGFMPAGHRKNFYSAPQEDALLLTKMLAEEGTPAPQAGGIQ